MRRMKCRSFVRRSLRRPRSLTAACAAAVLGCILALPVAPALFAASSDAANRGMLRDDQPGVHIVVRGDTLWDISGRFLTQPWRWPEIWRVNPEIENPHLIYPGDVIRLRWMDGEPVLELERGDPGRTVRVIPANTERMQPRVRYEDMVSAIPSIDLEAVGPFLTGNRIVGLAELEAAPYVIQGESGRLLTGAGDRMYARGEFGEVGDAFSVVRRALTLVDPDTGDMLGLEAEEVGAARITSLDADIATMAVTGSREDIRIGDRLLPMEERALEPRFFPSAPDALVKGRIIRVLSGVTQVGQYSVVALNVGGREGLAPGNVLAIRQQGALVRDRERNEQIRLPSEEAGLLMVFRVFDRVAYGLVLESRRPLAVLDEVVNP